MAFFQVSNIITTTGFGYGDITNWPLFSQFILLFLMGIGGSAGSTAGGLKVIRGLILSKLPKTKFCQSYPHRVLTLHVNKTVIDKDTSIRFSALCHLFYDFAIPYLYCQPR